MNNKKESLNDLMPWLEIIADELNVKRVQVSVVAKSNRRDNKEVFYHYDTVNRKSVGFFRHRRKYA